MKPTSHIFDSIRVKPEKDRQTKRTQDPQCQWEGCTRAGTHKAPLGRAREGTYLLFCVNHVREYNKSYNYFSGMSDADIAAFQKDAMTGHRPTWRMNSDDATSGASAQAADAARGRIDDPYGFARARPRSGVHADARIGRKVLKLEKKSLSTLNLDTDATAHDIKTRYKELVKRLHPDANGGDRGTEARLREIIKAYNHLKSAGFC